MNKKYFHVVTISGWLLLTCVTGFAQSWSTLTVQVGNLKGGKGKAVAQLFRKDDNIPGEPFIEASSKIEDGKATITFEHVEYGEYAIILFHDENENGILDHRFGFPNEPMGFSNQWKLSLFSGMPTFSKLNFKFSNDKKVISKLIQ